VRRPGCRPQGRLRPHRDKSVARTTLCRVEPCPPDRVRHRTHSGCVARRSPDATHVCVALRRASRPTSAGGAGRALPPVDETAQPTSDRSRRRHRHRHAGPPRLRPRRRSPAARPSFGRTTATRHEHGDRSRAGRHWRSAVSPRARWQPAVPRDPAPARGPHAGAVTPGGRRRRGTSCAWGSGRVSGTGPWLYKARCRQVRSIGVFRDGRVGR
jgi:hypothetical protein